MAVSTFCVEFEGYWLEQVREDIPVGGGIYCVYSCVYNLTTGTLLPVKLLYVGNSDNARESIATHGKRPDWEKHLKTSGGGRLCYSFAKVAPCIRERCRAAIIHRHKPPENLKHVGSFPYQQTTMLTSGSNMLLTRKLTVCKSRTWAGSHYSGPWRSGNNKEKETC